MLVHKPNGEDWLIVTKEQQLLSLPEKPWALLRVRDIDSQLFAQLLSEQLPSTPSCFFRLGEFHSSLCYVVDISDTGDNYTWVTLRSQLSRLSSEEYQLASRALQLVTWAQQHQYCGQCGQQTEHHTAEAALHCPRCAIFYYPRISPCMMCLITKGDSCLLAHHEKHPESLYTTLAGFVEAGESLEQALHREVGEEVGLRVSNLEYFSSQSWPFPHQLMVGYFSEYQSGDIVVDGDEITDAQWFRYNELPQVPPPETLSGQMIRAFVKRQKAIHR